MHIPVLLKEVITLLDPKPGEFFIDGTFGGGGHTRAIKEKVGLKGKVFSIDWEKTGENFADLPSIMMKKKLTKSDGLLLDLGFSSEQLESGRGFSFQKDEPLLMTYNTQTKPVKDVLNELTENELADVLYNYGEERYSRRIAAAIKHSSRPIETTHALAEAVMRSVPKRYTRGKIHPATKTFMALRIYANHELENIETLLKNIFNIVKSGGRVAIIAFHSLEDRIVKNYFRQYAKVDKLTILTKKPITAGKEEALSNPRARSAKLRVAQLL